MYRILVVGGSLGICGAACLSQDRVHIGFWRRRRVDSIYGVHLRGWLACRVGTCEGRQARSRAWNVNKFFGVVPFDSEATIKFAFPVGGKGVKVLQGIDEMVGIVFANIFDAKVVNNEAEGDVTALVPPKAGGLRRWGVAVFGEVGLESNVGKEAGLFEAVHAFANFNVHPPVGGW